jgi:hypothetical protein
MTSPRRLAAALLALALSGCAGLEAGPAKGLAGRWEGHTSGVGGNLPVHLVVKEDGAYLGVLRVDGEERGIQGAITELPSGRLRFDGSSGSGTVTRRARAGERVLRFERDDGYPLFEVVARPEPPESPEPKKE